MFCCCILSFPRVGRVWIRTLLLHFRLAVLCYYARERFRGLHSRRRAVSTPFPRGLILLIKQQQYPHQLKWGGNPDDGDNERIWNTFYILIQIRFCQYKDSLSPPGPHARQEAVFVLREFWWRNIGLPFFRRRIMRLCPSARRPVKEDMA